MSGKQNTKRSNNRGQGKLPCPAFFMPSNDTCIVCRRAVGSSACKSRRNPSQFGAVDKVSLRSALPTKKDALWRHPACFIIRFRFNAVADKRQWSSAASKPRRKTRAKLCSRFCAENEPSHQTCRSFSASRYSGLERRSRLRCRSAAK